MIEKEVYLSKYNIAESDLEKAQITWEELELIANEYEAMDAELHVIGKDFIDATRYNRETFGYLITQSDF